MSLSRALDPGTRAALHDEFLELQARLKKTVVLVTHDLLEAGRLAEEIILLDAGQVVQRGTMRDLLLKPADDRARAFLGRTGADLATAMRQLGQPATDLPKDVLSCLAPRSSPT